MTLAQGMQVLEIFSRFRHDSCEKQNRESCIHEKEPMLLQLLSRFEALMDAHIYRGSQREGTSTSTVAGTATSV
jgi:hypothetical protein